MNIKDVVLRAVSDPVFAAELHAEATGAAKGGVGSPEWNKYMAHFASSPQELAALSAGNGVEPLGFTTLTTTTTYTTAACTTTGTTTTTTTN